MVTPSIGFSGAGGITSGGSVASALFAGSALVVASDAPSEVIRAAERNKRFFGDLIQIADGTDDDVEIQAAIDAAYSVILSEGRFVASSPIQCRDGTKLRGQGWRTIIQIVDSVDIGTTGIVVLSNGTEVSDIRFDGNATNGAGGHLIYGNGTQITTGEVFVHDVWVEDADGKGMRFQNGAKGFIVERVHSDGTGSYALEAVSCSSFTISSFDIKQEDGKGIQCTNSTDFSVTSIRVRTISDSPVSSTGNNGVLADTACSDFVISDCNIEGTGGFGILLSDRSKNFTVGPNTARDCRFAGLGIDVASSPGVMEDANGSVVGGQYSGATQHGVRVNLARYITISGVSVSENQQTGVSIGDCEDISIIGINARGNADDGIDDQGARTLISSSQFTGHNGTGATAINCRGSGTTIRDNRMDDNDIDIDVNSNSGVTIRGNVISANTTKIANIASDTVIRGNDGLVGTGDVVTIRKTIDHADLTDNADATVQVDFDDNIPAHSAFMTAKVEFDEAWNSDNTTTLTLQIGDGSDNDRFNTTASGENIFNTTTTQSWSERGGGIQGTVDIGGSAVTPRLLFTEDDDGTDIISDSGAQGKLTAYITYVKL